MKIHLIGCNLPTRLVWHAMADDIWAKMLLSARHTQYGKEGVVCIAIAMTGMAPYNKESN